eukprot:Nitzschia sp. Nitz4//scaffold127_size64804//63557//64405//NITZ4_006191-RA/size64804-processed-gene-0.86-mRNA-1//-1//CDS//3329534795//392//frame0
MFLLQRTKSCSMLQTDMHEKLGDGPMRFGPVLPKTRRVPFLLEEDELSDEKLFQFATIKRTWEGSQLAKEKKFSKAHIFRSAVFCDFNLEETISLLKSANRRSFQLLPRNLENQLLSKIAFPCPGLRTREGELVVYMRVANISLSTFSTENIIDNLIFVMDHVSARNPSKSLCLVINMAGWEHYNFKSNFYVELLDLVQRRLHPADVSSMLLVDTPPSFGPVWKSMGGFIAPSYSKHVLSITHDELPYFMELDFEKSLPNEFPGGEVDTDQLASDFLSFCLA